MCTERPGPKSLAILSSDYSYTGAPLLEARKPRMLLPALNSKVERQNKLHTSHTSPPALGLRAVDVAKLTRYEKLGFGVYRKKAAMAPAPAMRPATLWEAAPV